MIIYSNRSGGYFHLQRSYLRDFLRIATECDASDKADCYRVQGDKISKISKIGD